MAFSGSASRYTASAPRYTRISILYALDEGRKKCIECLPAQWGLSCIGFLARGSKGIYLCPSRANYLSDLLCVSHPCARALFAPLDRMRGTRNSIPASFRHSMPSCFPPARRKNLFFPLFTRPFLFCVSLRASY